MGDPKKLKKKYLSPSHPWNKVAIEAEAILKKEYGLVNKKEIFLANTFLKKYKDLAKKLIATKTVQAEHEKKLVLVKLQKYGLLPAGASLDQILSLETKDILERRLQTITNKKGLARSVKQARQFITHRHIIVGDKEITSPAYMLSLEEESKLSFKPESSLSNLDHPERMNLAKEIKEEAEEVKPKKESKKKKEEKEITVEENTKS
ncbi:30S ribosomal protein S4 [Candidatus Woesearchaeota archaeon]|nr:30S ribosomal protein S4 [Candidatus Woesearchaeota archaeon]